MDADKVREVLMIVGSNPGRESWMKRIWREVAGVPKDPNTGMPKVEPHALFQRAKLWTPREPDDSQSVMNRVANRMADAYAQMFTPLFWTSPSQNFQFTNISKGLDEWLEKETYPALGYTGTELTGLSCSEPAYIAAMEERRKVDEELTRQRREEEIRKRKRSEQLRSLATRPSIKPEPIPFERKSPDVIGFLAGWRVWSVDPEVSVLSSTGVEDYWMPRFAVPAKCNNGNTHFCPEIHCSCGYYTFKEFDQFIKTSENFTHQDFVFGPVYVWGKVIETQYGYRSQFAYPKELWCMNPEHVKLGAIYNVPVRVIEE